MFWEDNHGLMYYFDKNKWNGIDKEKMKCPKNMHIYSTGITGSGDIDEVTKKAKEFGLEPNSGIFHQLICVENSDTFVDKEFDSKPNFSHAFMKLSELYCFRMSSELG